MKRFIIFTIFCLCVNVCRAEKYITFDTIALDTAMNEITKVGSESKYKTVEDAGVALYDAIYKASTSEDTIEQTKMIDSCMEMIKDVKTCAKFMNTYRKYLDHANYCKQANKFKAGNFTFQNCYEYVMNDDTSYKKKDTNGTIYKQCQEWIETGAKCRFYLFGYYTDKINDAGTSSSNKKHYECVLNKLEKDTIDFPMSNMEKSCK